MVEKGDCWVSLDGVGRFLRDIGDWFWNKERLRRMTEEELSAIGSRIEGVGRVLSVSGKL